MLHSAASDLGLHCLPLSLLWDARHKWVKLLQHTNVSNPETGSCQVVHFVPENEASPRGCHSQIWI